MTTTRTTLLGCALLLAACTKHEAKKPVPAVDPAILDELGELMKTEINPPFSKLSFLVFHGEGMDDKAVLRTEIEASTAALRKGVGRLRAWQRPPTTTAEGREVFYSFAASVDTSLAKFEAAVSAGDDQAAADALGQTAKTCDNCHHFFRIETPDAETPGAMAPAAAPPAQSL